MPAVSVVLPTFNRASTLARAIRSVLAQTFSDLELIIVDDASTDGTEALVRTFKDSRIRYMCLTHNHGAAGARNAGIGVAGGQWVAFQDSDDEWLTDKLERQLAVLKQGTASVGLVLGSYLVFDGRLPFQIRPQSTLADKTPLPDLLGGWPIITPTWLVKRNLLQAVDGFNEVFPCLEDWDLVFRLLDRCEIRAVEEPILVKHGSVDSICADPERLYSALKMILDTHSHRWAGYPRHHARRLAHFGVLQYRLGKRQEARASFRHARALVPREAVTHALLWASYLGHDAIRAVQCINPHFASMAP